MSSLHVHGEKISRRLLELEYKNVEKEKVWLLTSAVPGLMKGIN